MAGAAFAALLLVAQPSVASAQSTTPQASANHSATMKVVQELQDRVLIEQLMWDYVRSIDSFNADAYASVFTPDGTFNTVKGSEALRKMVVDMKQGQDARRAKGEHIAPMHHFMTNQVIEFIDPNHARVRYYWQTVFADPGLTPPPRLAAAGRGVDDVVRVDGKWLIQSRNVAPKD